MDDPRFDSFVSIVFGTLSSLIVAHCYVCVSGVGSASKLRDFDDWQDQRLSTTDDDLVSPYSDSSTNDLDQIRLQELTKNGTYVIRRGRKKERTGLPKAPTKTRSLSFENGEENQLSDVKRYSSTFDNIRSLLREGKLEPMNEPPAEFAAPVPPDLVRVVSLPAINDETGNRGQLEVTVEEEETSDVSDKDKTREGVQLVRMSPMAPATVSVSFSIPLSPSNEEQRRADIDHRHQDRPNECNGVSLSASKIGTVVGVATAASSAAPAGKIVEEPLGAGSRKSPNTSVGNDQRLASKIPVNLLIEDQIVKKALKENRRQLEKVSDAIKEIESVKNSESYSESKRWRNGDAKMMAKRNSLENEPNERKILDGLPDSRPRKRHDSDVDSDASKTSPETDFDARRTNGTDAGVYSSGRRSRQNGVECHKNDQKQIENVIDAILEDSKNPDFQVSWSDAHRRLRVKIFPHGFGRLVHQSVSESTFAQRFRR